MFNISKDTQLQGTHIIKFIEMFKMQHLPRLQKLNKYYLGQNDIKNRVFADLSKPNNRIAHSWGNYITDSMTAFFIGEPISYSGEDKDIEQLNYIFNQNDEQDLNSKLAKDASKFGQGFELFYLDESADIKLTTISPMGAIPIYSDTVEDELIYFIRFIENKDILTDQMTTHIWLYSDKSIKYFTLTDGKTLLFQNETFHNFEIVPISIYKNNDDLMGDYESVIDLIDLYDRIESDTANANDYYNDCYLVFTGANLEPEDVIEMKTNRVIEMPEGSTVQFLTKNANDIEQENTKNRIVNDIHKFSKVPNMSDESFANNVSGVAMKYKLLGLENSCSIKERKFKRGLQNRLWLISNILGLKNGTDLQDVRITFTRNIPNNEIEIADMVNKLRGLVSTETLINQLSFVENAKAEMEQLALEQEMNSYKFDFDEEVVDEDEEE